MKHLVLFLLFLTLAVTATAQTKLKINGRTITVDTSKVAAKSTAVKTEYIFIDRSGNKYPVFKSARGKYFYNKVSGTTGNPYKVYLKLE